MIFFFILSLKSRYHRKRKKERILKNANNSLKTMCGLKNKEVNKFNVNIIEIVLRKKSQGLRR